MCYLHENGSSNSVYSNPTSLAKALSIHPQSPSAISSTFGVDEAQSDMEDFIEDTKEDDPIPQDEVLEVGLSTIGAKEVYQGDSGYSVFQKVDGAYVCAPSGPLDELDGESLAGEDVTDMLPEYWSENTLTPIQQNQSHSSLDEAVNSINDSRIQRLHNYGN